ncbi:esterase-like activity of phytase family protein [Donghicola sp. C2-DW-16]|uniref:Esterase-like activity of phytase family protein n=1 Tax=Donghicola mangrovi TaxID=2729614 RepID=A0ABX2PHC9_9RHOB|nr:esterase-like activity of phytase family protein [Donghicola mangrovi]NVO27994.1 esterase-like activity of phytase family protein [Donghicola mangrovi]
MTRRKLLFAIVIGLIPLASCAAPRIIEGGIVPYPSIGRTELQPAGRIWISISDPITGGQSGIAAINHGAGFWMVSDRGTLTKATAKRDPDGTLIGMELVRTYDLRQRGEDTYITQMRNDAEDLAWGAKGQLYVSFEGYAQVAELMGDGMARHNLIDDDIFVRARGNKLFEALAPLPDGSLLAITEDRPDLDVLELFEISGSLAPDETSIPVVRVWPRHLRPDGFVMLTSGGWVPVDPGWDISGADSADDGSVWILERSIGFLGFSSRIRRFPLGENGLPDWQSGQVMLETRPGDLGNMEGLTLWRPEGGGPQHLTLVSDNDNSSFRTTLVAEYIWPDAR